MKKSLILLAALFLSATVAATGPKPQSGSILSHTSVECGSKKSKKQDVDLLCQQYVVRSGTTDYTIRQPKPSDQAIIPLNTAIEFKIDKNKMKFKVDGKSFEFMVISQAAASSPAARTGLFPSQSSVARAVRNDSMICYSNVKMSPKRPDDSVTSLLVDISKNAIHAADRR
jgi:hypothetical protein